MKGLINKITLGDCLQVMKQIPDNSVDLIVTDPPYLYKITGGCGKSSLKNLQKFKTGLNHIKDGFDVDFVFSEFKRITKKFNLFCFCSNAQISEIMKWGEDNNYSTTLLVWNKYNAVPFANGTWRQDAEFIVHIREKGATFQGDSFLKRKVRKHSTVVSKWGHPTEKPISIISDYIEIGSNENDLVLDPFSGSGTTALACHELKRNFIAIEKDQEYHRLSCERLKQVQAQGVFNF